MPIISAAPRVTAPLPAAVPTTPAPAPTVAFGPQPTYRFDLTVDPDARTLAGSGSVHVVNNQAAPLTEVYLRLWPNATHFTKMGGSETLQHVTLDGAPVDAQIDRTVVKVPLATPLAQGAAVDIAFDLHIQAPQADDRFGVDRNGTVLFGNALPTVAVRDAEGWNLDPYVPFGEPFYTLSSNWAVTLHAPKGATTIVSGVSTPAANDATVTHIVAPDVRDFFLAAGRNLQVREQTVDGTKVRLYTAPQDAANAADLLKAATESLHFFNTKYGTYDYPELNVIGATDFVAGGMEYPNVTVVNGSMWKSSIEHATVHENGHQWFYGIAGNNEYDDPWLDESLTEYITQKFLQSKGHLPADPTLVAPPRANAGDKHISSPVSVLAAHGDTGSYVQTAYGDGPRMLFQLEKEIGEATVTQAMRAYFEASRHGVGTGASFVAAVNQAAGRDLTPWFAQHRVFADEPAANVKLDPNGPAAEGVPADA